MSTYDESSRTAGTTGMTGTTGTTGMTGTAGTSGTTGAGGGDAGLKERATDAVGEVDQAAKHVAGVAGDEAGNVVHEAKDAARGFFAETKTQLTEQASHQQRRAAQALRATGDQFSRMADGSQDSGMAGALVSRLGEHASSVGAWLDAREPADIMREVRGFARRHTGAFIVGALAVGLVAGRLVRATVAASNGSGSGSGSMGRTSPAALAAQSSGGADAGQAGASYAAGVGTAGATSGGAMSGGVTGATGGGYAGSVEGGGSVGDDAFDPVVNRGGMPTGAGQETPIADALANEPMATAPDDAYAAGAPGSSPATDTADDVDWPDASGDRPQTGGVGR